MQLKVRWACELDSDESPSDLNSETMGATVRSNESLRRTGCSSRRTRGRCAALRFCIDFPRANATPRRASNSWVLAARIRRSVYTTLNHRKNGPLIGYIINPSEVDFTFVLLRSEVLLTRGFSTSELAVPRGALKCLLPSTRSLDRSLIAFSGMVGLRWLTGIFRETSMRLAIGCAPGTMLMVAAIQGQSIHSF